MEQYSKNFKIDFRDVDKTERLRINVLVDFMQETSREHAMVLGTDFSSSDSSCFWVIIRTKVKLDKLPVLDDEIRIDTFVVGVDGLFAVRRFEIFDAVGNLIGHIIGYYLLIDRANNRPVRFKKSIELYSWANLKYDGKRLEKLVVVDDTVVREEFRKVFSGDIDCNGHMNNVRYVAWSLDMFSSTELVDKPALGIQIQYIHELKEGDIVQLTRFADGIVVGKRDEVVCFVIKVDC